MADSKISLLTALAAASVDATDVFPIVDISATTTKKITSADVATYVAGTTDITTPLALKANLASTTFTGTPTLPTGTIATTQTAANNSTAVATTAFVTTAVATVSVDFSSDQAVLSGTVFN